MTRIVASLIMMFGSIVLYLSIRATEKYNLSIETQNFAMFVPAMLFFGVRCWWGGYELWQGRGWTALMIIGFIFFSWLANVFSLKALALAPNPGYSLILSKSYVILSSLLAIPILDAPFTWVDALAILFIVSFSALILIQPATKVSSYKSSAWIYFSLYAFVGWALLAIFITYLLQQGLPVLVVIFRMFLTTSACILIDISLRKKTIHINKQVLLFVGGIIFGMILLNWGIVTGYSLAPNPGYLNAVNVASIAFITLLSSWIFKDELSMRKMIGIVGVVVGITILFVF